MWQKEELVFDLITRDAVLILGGHLHRLEGPFDSRAEATQAAELLKMRLAELSATTAA